MFSLGAGVADGQVTMDDVLADRTPRPYSLADFRTYLVREHSDENLDFYLDTLQYEKLYEAVTPAGDPGCEVPASPRLCCYPTAAVAGALRNQEVPRKQSFLRRKIDYITQEYLLSTSPREINISDTIRTKLLREIIELGNLQPSVFEPCKNHVIHLMSTASFQNFLNSVAADGEYCTRCDSSFQSSIASLRPITAPSARREEFTEERPQKLLTRDRRLPGCSCDVEGGGSVDDNYLSELGSLGSPEAKEGYGRFSSSLPTSQLVAPPPVSTTAALCSSPFPCWLSGGIWLTPYEGTRRPAATEASNSSNSVDPELDFPPAASGRSNRLGVSSTQSLHVSTRRSTSLSVAPWMLEDGVETPSKLLGKQKKKSATRTHSQPVNGDADSPMASPSSSSEKVQGLISKVMGMFSGHHRQASSHNHHHDQHQQQQQQQQHRCLQKSPSPLYSEPSSPTSPLLRQSALLAAADTAAVVAEIEDGRASYRKWRVVAASMFVKGRGGAAPHRMASSLSSSTSSRSPTPSSPTTS